MFLENIENWKCWIQKQGETRRAVRELTGRKDGLVVLPTGCEKSLVYMELAVELVNKFVILIEPLVALQRGVLMQFIT